MKNNLSKEEMYSAIVEGIKSAIHEMCDTGNGFNGLIRKDEIFEKIESGNYRAFWQLFTNATDMPCSDFYHQIKEGVKEAISDMDIEGIVKESIQDDLTLKNNI